MSIPTLIQEKPVKDIPTVRLEHYHASILNEIKTLESTTDTWWKTEKQAEYQHLLEAGRAALKEIESEIARRSAAHLHSLVQRIGQPPTKETVKQNQEGAGTHDRQP